MKLYNEANNPKWSIVKCIAYNCSYMKKAAMYCFDVEEFWKNKNNKKSNRGLFLMDMPKRTMVAEAIRIVG